MTDDARARILAAYTDPTTPPFPGAVAMICAECETFLIWTNPPLPSVPMVCSEHHGPGKLAVYSTKEPTVGDDFWAVINTQLDELRTATTADDVLRILSQDRNPYGRDSSSADGFFAGSGGDVAWALLESGWFTIWVTADYHWAKRARNGDVITYVEGDVYRGNRASRIR